MPPESSGRAPWRSLVALQAVFWTQFPWVGTTNFYGFDEWTVTHLVSRGIVGVPHANRPLGLVAALPVPALGRFSFAPYSILYAAYCSLSAWLLYLLCRRLAPEPVALLAGCVFLVWAPSDFARLATVERTLYGGVTFGMLAAAWLLVQSWARESAPLLALAVLAAFLTARSYEGTVPFLLAAPLFAGGLRPERGRRLWGWVAAWEGSLGLAIILVLGPILFPGNEPRYLPGAGLNLNPLALLRPLLRQYDLHLRPLVTSAPGELAAPAVPIAVAVFLAAWAAAARHGEAQYSRRRLVRSMALGLVLAGLGYGIVVARPSQVGELEAWRMEFLSAPGIALFLAAGAALLASLAKGCWRGAVVAALGAWIVALGTGRTVAMQGRFDSASYYALQDRVLSRLVEVAPDLKPHTLVVLIDEVGAWRASFGFRHAVEYLYQGRGAGYVWGSFDVMFPTSFGPAGIRCEPWPAVRRAWLEPATLHRYDEVVVARFGASRDVSIEQRWPPEMPPLPAGARYEPGARIVSGGIPPPEHAILGRR